MDRSFILKGHICHTPVPGEPEIRENAYVVCEDGICRGIFGRIPEWYAGLEVIDCTGRLIIPGMVDLHVHAPQYAFIGTGMDHELLKWLELVTFPEEVRYAETEYAARAYGLFSRKMRESATTRAVIFGTIHTEATLRLMDLMEESGLVTYVGKVSMDRGMAPGTAEKDALSAAAEEIRFIRESGRRGYRRTKPIVTPRFVPACTNELMEALGQIREEYGLPVQSHLSENPEEVELVGRLEPEAAFYGEVYDRYGLFGGTERETGKTGSSGAGSGERTPEACGHTVMAHCIWSVPEEVERIRDNGVWIAHCPASNMNLASGIAPVRRYLDAGIRLGLGTDVAGGHSTSMFRAVTDAIQVSKLYWRYIDRTAKPLTFPESFYMATKGGGSFFGKAGSFENGSAFDALVLDDSSEPCVHELSVRERLERAFYLEMDRGGIIMKYADGEKIF